MLNKNNLGPLMWMQVKELMCSDRSLYHLISSEAVLRSACEQIICWRVVSEAVE